MESETGRPRWVAYVGSTPTRRARHHHYIPLACLDGYGDLLCPDSECGGHHPVFRKPHRNFCRPYKTGGQIPISMTGAFSYRRLRRPSPQPSPTRGRGSNTGQRQRSLHSLARLPAPVDTSGRSSPCSAMCSLWRSMRVQEAFALVGCCCSERAIPLPGGTFAALP
jgi:hypothetical protein